MFDFIFSIWDVILNFWQQEWFWAIVAILVTLIVFILGQRSENKISRAGFIYNISNDFANNDRILKVYQWLEGCRRKSDNVDNYRLLNLTASTSIFDKGEEKELEIDFIDIDTYINHFESVYIILKTVKIKSIDELFQQRFFSFMMNPFIQREELFECFSSDKNDFLLYKKWLKSIYRRKNFNNNALIIYLKKYTCGNFEFNFRIKKTHNFFKRITTYFKVRHYLFNYVYYICDPMCKYGYYKFANRNGEKKTLRIIKSSESDADDILKLQDRVVGNMDNPEWFCKSTQEEIKTALKNPDDYLCIQVADNSKIVAFAYVILQPSEEHNLYLDLKKEHIDTPSDKYCIFETVFVDNDYRGYGIQSLLVDVLCDWSRKKGKHSICATVHPNNKYSQRNFENRGFEKVTACPITKYNNKRNYFIKKLAKRNFFRNQNDTYTIFPET